MKSPFRRSTRYALALSLFVVPLSPLNGFGENWEQGKRMNVAKLTLDTPATMAERPVFDRNHPEMKAVIAVQNRHTPDLMAIPEVVGTATGLTETGRPAVHVFIREAVPAGVIPAHLEGVPVVVKVTGDIVAMAGTSTTSWFDSPVPIGVSTGNIGECSAGTIGARVKKSDGTLYALSNNHVYALENTATASSAVVQPGRYDTDCSINYANQIGKLSAYVPIKFRKGTNTVDAAIAQVNYDTDNMRALGNTTPSDGYGMPNSTTASASIGQAVTKYGRTTASTTGSVTGINATVRVNYGRFGFAKFVNQITVSSATAFLLSGDSGSLMVTNNSGNYPVGLLFAGNSSGTFAVANPIGLVLDSFKVTIDGK